MGEWNQRWQSSDKSIVRFPQWLSGKAATCQCRRHRFDPWVGKMPWRRKWQPTPVFLPGKSHGQRSLVGCSPRVTTEQACTATAMSPMHLYAPGVRMKPGGQLQPFLGRVSLNGNQEDLHWVFHLWRAATYQALLSTFSDINKPSRPIWDTGLILFHRTGSQSRVENGSSLPASQTPSHSWFHCPVFHFFHSIYLYLKWLTVVVCLWIPRWCLINMYWVNEWTCSRPCICWHPG